MVDTCTYLTSKTRNAFHLVVNVLCVGEVWLSLVMTLCNNYPIVYIQVVVLVELARLVQIQIKHVICMACDLLVCRVHFS